MNAVKKWHHGCALTNSRLSVITLLCLTACVASAEELHVPGEYGTIQAAIDAADPGDEVIIADGTYTGDGNRDLDFNGKDIVVRSASDDPALCIIDCDGEPENPHRGFHFHSGETSAAVVRGLTIANGHSGWESPGAYQGGGIRCTDAGATFIHCVIRDNQSETFPDLNGSGGGVYCLNADLTFIGCTISGNGALSGGGFSCSDSSVTLTNCIVARNSAFMKPFVDGVGGGFSIGGTDLTLSNCLLTGNSVSGEWSHQGGVLSGVGGTVTITNCTIAGNSTWCSDDPNCSLIDCSADELTITNCVIWGNTPTYISLGTGGNVTVTYCDIEDGTGEPWFGVGCVEVNPAFVDANGPDNDPSTWEDNDFRLLAGSAGIDAGDPAFTPAPDEADLDGHYRVWDGDGDGVAVVDMGAYEYVPNDCNENWIPDECDVDCGAPGGPCDIAGCGQASDCNGNSVPDECDIALGTSADCNGNLIPDECDIAAGTSTDYDLGGIPDECEDCNDNGVSDLCDVDCATGNCGDCPLGCGTSADCQSNDVPDECELADNDCNANLVPDECDIALGTSLDCNANLVPDECDIALGTSLDCNENGLPDECELADNDCNANLIPDDCDIAFGTSDDCQPNGLPDECEVMPQLEDALLAMDGAEGEFLGASVAISGNTAIVGAPSARVSGISCGAAYVFRKENEAWIQADKLIAVDGEQYDFFGGSVAVHDDVAVVGAYGDDDLGSVYVYRHSGGAWGQETVLVAADGVPGATFGDSVAVSGNRIFIGASEDDGLGWSSGSVYVFVYDGSNWIQETKLVASDGEPDDRFGCSVAVSGDVIVVGAEGEDDLASSAGAAYVFRYDGSDWTQEAKLVANDGAQSDYFGRAVTASDEIIVVGANGDDDVARDAGAAYVFRRSGITWTQEEKLLPETTESYHTFGCSVAAAGNTIVVGATGGFGIGSETDSVYVFRNNGDGWTREWKLLPPNDVGGIRFGASVALDVNRFVVGATNADELGENSGAAYAFYIPDANGNGLPDDCEWCLGDLNCSNAAPDFADIMYFVAALNGEANWQQYYRDHHDGEDPPCPWLLGDFSDPPNGVDFADILPFANSVGQPCVPYWP